MCRECYCGCTNQLTKWEPANGHLSGNKNYKPKIFDSGETIGQNSIYWEDCWEAAQSSSSVLGFWNQA